MASPYTQDLSAEAAEIGRLAGYDLLPWQRSRLADWSAYGPGGAWVHRQVADCVPRQAGKSVDGVVWSTFLAAVLGYKVLWTDHNYSTTCEMMRRFQAVFGKRPGDPNADPAFNRLVRACNNKTAQESIALSNGGLIAFSTRTKTAALGYSFDAVVFDEAQDLTDEQAQAIIPTTSSCASGNPQLIYLGTPTRAGSVADSFQALRARAWSGDAEGLTWCEYGVDDPACVDDEESWYTANPSLGTVTTIDAIRLGRRGTSDLAFAQEYLGYWLPKQADAVVSAEQWAACEVAEDAVPDGRVAYGVKFSPDGQYVALAAAVHPASGPDYVELQELSSRSRGIGWLADWLESRCRTGCCVAVDGLDGTGDLMDRLEGRVPRRFPVRARSADVVTAASMLRDAIVCGDVCHMASPALDESVVSATRRPVGGNGGWGWGGDSCAVEAASLALWAVRTTKRNPARKQVLW